MAEYNIFGDVFTQNQNYIFEFGAPESHQQRTVNVGLNDSRFNAALVQNINGRQMVKQGTPYPTNDANCEGVIMWDYDVTNGDRLAALVHRGDINLYRLYEYLGYMPAVAALQVLHEDYEFQFFPQDYYKGIIDGTITPTAAIVGSAVIDESEVG